MLCRVCLLKKTKKQNTNTIIMLYFTCKNRDRYRKKKNYCKLYICKNNANDLSDLFLIISNKTIHCCCAISFKHLADDVK